MISRNFYFQLVIRVISLAINALLIAFTLFQEYYAWVIILVFIFLSQTLLLIKYLNQNNRKIAFFFNSIKNEDFTLSFPEQGNAKSFNELNHSLNSFNTMMQKVYIKNQAQEKYYQEILNQAEIGILTFNAKGHILFANPKVEKLLNYTPLNHLKQLALVDEELYEMFNDLTSFERRLFQLTNERETIQLVIKSNEIILNQEILNLVTIQDIDSELDKKETDSWMKLIRVLTHEIMNTVTPITSISESILNYYVNENGILPLEQLDESKIRLTAKGLEVIKEQGKDLMSFVQSYRSFLNVPNPDKEIIDVKKLLEKIKVLINPETELPKISIHHTNSEETIEIFADEKLVTQVLINLTKNAIQALKGIEDGKVSLISGTTDKGKKYISVVDNGPGIPPENMNQIFVPFYTTKNDGTGIGLSLSKQIMHLHGGSLTVHSVPYKETSFSLFF